MDVTTTNHSPTRRFVAIGVVAAGLCVAGTGVATAAAPTSALSRSVTEILQSAGVDWSTMPDGYTPEQYEAFWGAGYTPENVEELGALWNLEATETKARAGQLILDGQPVPVAAGDAARRPSPPWCSRTSSSRRSGTPGTRPRTSRRSARSGTASSSRPRRGSVR